MRLGVLGDPLDFTRSPELHRAGLAALGLEGRSEAIRVRPERLGTALGELAAAGFRGVNLTHPLKEAALAHLATVSAPAARARSVNTVCFDGGVARGETTDGAGFVDLLRERGRSPEGARVVLLGAGGAARSLGLSLLAARASVSVWARRPAAAAAAWGGIGGATIVDWDAGPAGDALAAADVVVNATPLAGAGGPCAPARIPRGALVVDLVYGAALTPWVLGLRAAGRDAIDGLGLLVHQARHSLALWCERPVPLEPLARAVGWPR